MFQRLVENRINSLLSVAKIVLVTGPRQSGKTTLVKKIATNKMSFLSLDNPTLIAAAQADPFGFINGKDPVVIDEVQRAPNLIKAIKSVIGSKRKAGRFLLTGSTNLTTKSLVSDELVSQLKSVSLFPLSQAEIQSGKGNFLNDVFDLKELTVGELQTGEKLINLIFAGGYPEALNRENQIRRSDWYRNYVNDIVHNDVPELAETPNTGEISKLIEIMADYSGNLMNYSKISIVANSSNVTIQKYIEILEKMFLVSRLEAWSSSKWNRLLKSPKQHLLDTGLLTSVRHISVDEILHNRSLFGTILETFVIAELRKLATWSNQSYQFSHLRDQDGKEVDVIIENDKQQIVGIEVKSSSTIQVSDFKHLHNLAEKVGKNLIQGIVLYDGEYITSFGERMLAVPISALWS